MHKIFMKNLIIAFLLNLFFAVFEFIGGAITNSVAIMSDAVHDMGDALSIGISCYLERKSKKQPDEKYTYGYARYSVLGALITSTVLLVGSVFVIGRSIMRIINPEPINYDGMLVFAIAGFIINLIAALITKDGHSLNSKSVNLHMLEDTLGWIVVLAGSIAIRFTDCIIIDPLMSIGISLFILIGSIRNVKESLEIIMEKSPIHLHEVEESIKKIDRVVDVHHIHVWSMDEDSNFCTMHVVTSDHSQDMKQKIKHALADCGVGHSTIEFENEGEECQNYECHVEHNKAEHHHHHHHHH